MREGRLVYTTSKRRSCWHSVVEHGMPPQEAPGTTTVALDLGDVHPAAISDGPDPVVVTCRALRSQHLYTAKRRAELGHRQRTCKRGARRWKRLHKRSNRLLHQQESRTRARDHQVSREGGQGAVERKAGTSAVGDVRAGADKGKFGKKSNQKISHRRHGNLRQSITYHAAAEGSTPELVNERYPSQTCPQGGGRHKPRGRRSVGGRGGFSEHRDGVGAVTLLAVQQHGSAGHSCPTGTTTYRIPYHVRVLRSPPDTGQGACGQPQAAAGLSPVRSVTGWRAVWQEEGRVWVQRSLKEERQAVELDDDLSAGACGSVGSATAPGGRDILAEAVHERLTSGEMAPAAVFQQRDHPRFAEDVGGGAHGCSTPSPTGRAGHGFASGLLPRERRPSSMVRVRLIMGQARAFP